MEAVPQFEETKRYEIQRALNEIARLQNDDEWTPTKLYRLASTVCPTPKDFEQLQDYIIYEDEKRTIRREYYGDSFRVKFIEEVWSQINKKLLVMDPLTQVAAMSVYPADNQRYYPFEDFSPAFFTRPLRSPGTFGYISGPVKKPLGVGKTDFAGRMMEMHLAEGSRVCTNILIDDMPPGLTQIWGMKDMLRTAVLNTFKGYVTTAYLDEFPQFISKEKGTSNTWIAFKKLLYLCRKIGLNINAIAQRDQEIPFVIQDMAVWHVQKQDKTILDYRRYSDNTHVVGVPGTTLKFKTGHPGSFEPGDLDIDGMHDYIVSREREAQNTGTHVDVLRAILEFLDMDASSITKQDLKSFAKVGYVYAGMTQAQIASFCFIDGRPVSKMTISNWLAKMGVEKGMKMEG